MNNEHIELLVHRATSCNLACVCHRSYDGQTNAVVPKVFVDPESTIPAHPFTNAVAMTTL